MKILLVEDDEPVAAMLVDVLTAQHYTVDVAADGELGLELAINWDYELILLDLQIPKLDGIRLCRKIRAQGFQKPILLLTAKDSSEDVVRGLDAGADDYVTKPYNLSELLARLRALLRRRETSLAPLVLTWEKLRVNLYAADVTYAEEPLALTPKEYSLLSLFLRNPQRAFSRSDILDRLWSIDASPSEGTVTNLIKDLRQKLKAAGMTAALLETVYGLGYRLKAPPQTRSIAEGSDASPPTMTTVLSRSEQTSDFDKQLMSINKVLQRYQKTFVDRVALLEQVEMSLQQGTLSQDLQLEAVQEAHRLAGTLGSFGYGTGSQLARTIEQLLHTELAPADRPSLTNLIAALKQELAGPPTPFSVHDVQPRTTHLVLTIDEETTFTQQLEAAASAWNIHLEVAPQIEMVQVVLAKVKPDAILLTLNPHQVEAALGLLQTLRIQLPAVPILVMTEHDRLVDRVTVSRLGVRRFLHKAVGTTQIVEALLQLLPRVATSDARVLLVDDDPLMLEGLQHHLQPWGLDVISLQDSSQFWDVLTVTKPDLLVLDLEMPTFDGIDLCRVVRQDLQWGNLPILVVTAHTDMTSIQQVFAAGADDFIGKPVVGPELVTRVISRLDRVRLQHELETMKRSIGA
ncbi:MAG: response regulator [Stenomitos rutilans HA7619-LM2]|nr:response regulator [Stenomitos rutilans HA7619-LM2]